MKRDDFIKLCVRMGYCSKSEAEKYAENKEEFSDDDFVEVWRKANNKIAPKDLHHIGVDCGYTTKSFEVQNGHKG